MRWTGVVVASLLCTVGFSQSVVGVYKAGLKHGKLSSAEAKRARATKERLTNASLKLNKDKSFGCILNGRIMRGTWSASSGKVMLKVKEVVGFSANQVAAMKADQKTAQLKIQGKTLIQLPTPAGKPILVWKKTG